MNRILIAAAAALSATACTPAPQSVEKKPVAAAEPAPPGPERHWISADGTGITGLAYQEAGETLLTLTCDQSAGALTASGAVPAPSGAAGAADGVSFSGQAFTGQKTEPAIPSHTAAIRVAVTPALLGAIAKATSVRLTSAGGFVETNPNEDGANLKRFGESCATLTQKRKP